MEGNMNSLIRNKLRRVYHVVSKVKLPSLVVVLGQACTLKCRDCANFSPYAGKNHLVYHVGGVCKNINNIVKICRYIDLLQLQGGEPFIYPYLDKVLDMVIKEDKIRHIDIATNGTVIPTKYIEYLCNDKITVRISNYKVVSKEQINNLCSFFDDNHINYYKYSFAEGDDKWAQCGNPDTIRENLDEIVEKRFEKCIFSHCLTLENGYIGKCSRCVHAADIQGFKPKDNDYVKADSKHLRRDLHRYRDYCTPENHYFMEACRYCYGTFYGEKVEPAIQLDKEIRKR